LLRKESEPAETPAVTTENSQWQSADILFHEFKSSAIWLEGPQLYIFTQPVNPGPSLLSPWDKSLADVPARAQEVLHVQQSLAQASLVEDNRERAERLKPYARCEMFPARELALQRFAQCGPAALPTIQSMLDDPLYAAEVEELTKAYSQASRPPFSLQIPDKLLRTFQCHFPDSFSERLHSNSWTLLAQLNICCSWP
jgi:hypothetical protein